MAFTNFYGGEFFGGGFFGGESSTDAPTTKTGGKGDNERRRKARGIFKPTGLPAQRKTKRGDPVVEARLAETQEIAREIALEAKGEVTPPDVRSAQQLLTMTPAEIAFEIGVLLQKAMRSEEEEIVLLALIAAAAIS